MDWYLKRMEKALSQNDARLLKSVWEPKVVGVPPSDTWRDLCVCPDGEIRFYGDINRKNIHVEGQKIYIASRDCGLSWKTYFADNPDEIGSSVRSPYSGRYLRLKLAPKDSGRKGTFALLSEHGPASAEVKWCRVTDDTVLDLRLPMPMRSRKRWLCAGQVRNADGLLHPVVMRSDDDGETWDTAELAPAPKHEIKWPHKGFRWQNYACEATIAELENGRLMALARTSQDYHYQYYSDDGGESWTAPAPSRFRGTLTMPTLFRLSDGRLLLFWCNTQPLPELDHTKQWPPLREGEISGEAGEDVFTNRDANHVAISEDDGRTWKGFREIFLNTIRNDPDFRTKAPGYHDTLDKSVHQFQALALPFGKILLAFGQHSTSRKLVIFDPDWICETGRKENFQYGMQNISTQVYLKSNSGNFRGFSGHCAWNRTNGAVLVPDPAGNFEEALLISRIQDKRLFSEVQGAVWNYPASYKGELKIKMRVVGEGVRVSLTDRWFNPIDETVRMLAQLSFDVTKEMAGPKEWTVLRIVWNLPEGKAGVFADEEKLFEKEIKEEVPNGFSYLHLQGLAQEVDFGGTLVKSFEKRDI